MILEAVFPARGLAFIRRIETEDRYAGSAILLPEQSRDAIARCQFVIESLGDYARCEDEDCERWHTKRHEHRHHLQCGDWILAKHRSWSPTPDPHVFVIKQDDILGKFVER